MAGQLAEAMHNLPTKFNDNYSQYLTLRNLHIFIEKNTQYLETFQHLITEIMSFTHQEFAEIDADFVATIAEKY